jgi:hypothetical protein
VTLTQTLGDSVIERKRRLERDPWTRRVLPTRT